MDTKLATREFRLSQWTAIIKACRESGMKVDDYCQQNNLSRHAYYYWLKKIKEATLADAGFVEIGTASPVSGPAAFSTQMIISTGKADLMVNESTPASLITKVLGVMDRAQ